MTSGQPVLRRHLNSFPEQWPNLILVVGVFAEASSLWVAVAADGGVPASWSQHSILKDHSISQVMEAASFNHGGAGIPSREVSL